MKGYRELGCVQQELSGMWRGEDLDCCARPSVLMGDRYVLVSDRGRYFDFGVGRTRQLRGDARGLCLYEISMISPKNRVGLCTDSPCLR